MTKYLTYQNCNLFNNTLFNKTDNPKVSIQQFIKLPKYSLLCSPKYSIKLQGITHVQNLGDDNVSVKVGALESITFEIYICNFILTIKKGFIVI